MALKRIKIRSGRRFFRCDKNGVFNYSTNAVPAGRELVVDDESKEFKMQTSKFDVLEDLGDTPQNVKAKSKGGDGSGGSEQENQGSQINIDGPVKSDEVHMLTDDQVVELATRMKIVNPLSRIKNWNPDTRRDKLKAHILAAEEITNEINGNKEQ